MIDLSTISIGRRFRFAWNKSTIKCRFDMSGVHFFSLLSLTPKVSTLGITNLCSDGRLVIFGDYDHVFLYRVKKDVVNLQDKHDIGTVVILSSGDEEIDYQGKEYGSYHIIGLSKLKYQELFRIMDETSVDRNFLNVPDYFNGHYHVLRIFPKFLKDWDKIKERPFLKTVMYAKTHRECSYPIYRFLQLYYGIGDISKRYSPKFDSLKSLQLVGYQTTENDAWNPFRNLSKLMTHKIAKESHPRRVEHVLHRKRLA